MFNNKVYVVLLKILPIIVLCFESMLNCITGIYIKGLFFIQNNHKVDIFF